MVTIPQIKAAHSKVKSGADFPAYIQDLKKSGIEKWVVNMKKKTCTYLDKDGSNILVENIPS